MSYNSIFVSCIILSVIIFQVHINELSVSDAHVRIRPWNPTRAKRIIAGVVTLPDPASASPSSHHPRNGPDGWAAREIVSTDSSGVQYRRRVGHHPRNVGIPHMHSNTSLSGGAGTTVSCRATVCFLLCLVGIGRLRHYRRYSKIIGRRWRRGLPFQSCGSPRVWASQRTITQ